MGEVIGATTTVLTWVAPTTMMGPAAPGDGGLPPARGLELWPWRDETNDNRELPPARDIPRQGWALNYNEKPLLFNILIHISK